MLKKLIMLVFLITGLSLAGCAGLKTYTAQTLADDVTIQKDEFDDSTYYEFPVSIVYHDELFNDHSLMFRIKKTRKSEIIPIVQTYYSGRGLYFIKQVQIRTDDDDIVIIEIPIGDTQYWGSGIVSENSSTTISGSQLQALRKMITAKKAFVRFVGKDRATNQELSAYDKEKLKGMFMVYDKINQE